MSDNTSFTNSYFDKQMVLHVRVNKFTQTIYQTRTPHKMNKITSALIHVPPFEFISTPKHPIN